MQAEHLQESQQHEQSTERLLLSLRIQKCVLFIPLIFQFHLILWLT